MFKKNRNLVLNAVLSLLLITASISCKASSGPALFLLEKEGKSCVAKIFDINKQESTTWFTIPSCPKSMDQFIFDQNQKRALVLHGGKYWTAAWKKNAKFESFADAYKLPAPKDVITSKTWFDRETGALRAGFLVELPHELKKNPRSDWWLEKFPNLTEEIASKPTFPAGIPSVALVVELGSDGKWKELAAKLTTSQSDVAPGMMVLSTFMTEKLGVTSLQDLLMDSTCAKQDCVATKLNFSDATKEWISKTFKSPNAEEGETTEPATYGYIALSEHDGFLYNIALGDTYHAVPPVFYCQGSANKLCETHESTALAEQQLSLSGKSPYVLVTEEYSGLQARLFKSGSKKAAHSFPKSSVVAWLPSDAWKEALK